MTTIARTFANLEDRIGLARETAAGDLPLAVLLAGWIKGEGIASGEAAANIAASLLESGAMTGAARVLSDTGIAPQVLRDGAVGVAAIQGMSPAQWATETFRHGHDDWRRL